MSNPISISDLRNFTNIEFNWDMRIIPYDGERKCTLFCGLDAAKSLGYANPKSTIYDRCKRSVMRYVTVKSKNRNGSFERPAKLAFIDEGDLYRLILGSRLPSAKRFENWLVDEVLPSIRSNGYYVTDNRVGKMLEDIRVIKEFLHRLETSYVRDIERRNLEESHDGIAVSNILGKSEPKHSIRLSFPNKSKYSMNSVAKLLSGDNYIIGRNKMLKVLRDQKIFQQTQQTIPYQRYIDNGCFKVELHPIPQLGIEVPVTYATPSGVKLIKDAVQDWIYKNPSDIEWLINFDFKDSYFPDDQDGVNNDDNKFECCICDDNGFIVLEEDGELAEQAKEWCKKHQAE